MHCSPANPSAPAESTAFGSACPRADDTVLTGAVGVADAASVRDPRFAGHSHSCGTPHPSASRMRPIAPESVTNATTLMRLPQ